MQPYLAIDTSTAVGGVAVGHAGGGVLAEVALGVRARHSEALLPAIDFALGAAGVEKGDLAGVVVGGGPGSFTGVRIAGATAKGLVYALDLPLYAYSGLLALAAGIGDPEGAVGALFDARRGEVYAAAYRFPGLAGFETVLEPGVRAIDEVLDAVGAEVSVWAGRGALRNRAVIEGVGGIVAPAHLGYPRAASLLWLVGLDPDAGRVHAPAAWEPAYLRASGAERAVRG